jgi:glycosyltransferase involved in cell wall biosynthesis
MKLSIVIAYHNEGQDFIVETIESILSTIDVKDYEIIVVDDCSDTPIKALNGVLWEIRHKVNLGVGEAFNSGVEMARSKNLFLMGSDVRFSNNNWASKMIKEIEKNPKSLICTSVVPLQKNFPEITFEVAKKYLTCDLYRGAFIKYFLRDGEKKDIIEAAWMPREFLPLRRADYVVPKESYEVPCILGAAYGVSKSWYNYIDGFWGHKFWGTLEPYISLKSWLFGGNCLVAPHIETAHIFNEPGQSGGHGDEAKYTIYKSYNRMLVAWLLFSVPDKNKLIGWLNETPNVLKAKEMIEENLQEIIKKRNQYRRKFKRTMAEIRDKSKL